MGTLLAFLSKGLAGIVIAAILASVVSGAASSQPDGIVHKSLERKDNSAGWLVLGFVASWW